MGGKDSAPPPPDYTPIANASEQQATLANQLGEDQLAWAKEQFADTSNVTNQVVNSMLTTQSANNAAAAQDRARYVNEFQPLEDQLVNDSNSYASGARKDLEMGRAAAQVGNQFGQQRQAATQNLESFGVDPSSTRYAALDIGLRSNQAAAQAASANQASEQVDATGRALRSEAINVGRGYPGQIAQTYGTALAAGSGAENSALGNVASGASTMGTDAQFMGLGNQALGVWGNTLSQGYNSQLAQFNANQQASSGWGSALGLLGGLGAGLLKFADGGEVPAAIPGMGAPQPASAVPNGPTSQPAGNMGAIPYSASPSGGAQTDDITAKVNAGEFIVPRDVVQWEGEKAMYGLITKAHKERQQMAQQRQALPVG